jgi:hypothetical protein
MKKATYLATPLFALALSLLLASTAALSAETEEQLVQQAKQRIAQFAQELKGELSAAIQNGGLQAGVEVCHEKAPQIAAKLSNDGWLLARTSLRSRNSNNAPNDWEREVMQQFAQLKAQGAEISSLVTTNLSENQFRLMKAIPTEAICLSCHGSTIAPAVQKQLDLYYPNDMATGFSLGDIRGAFTLTKHLNLEQK